MKNTEKVINTTHLNQAIKRWRLNVRMICEEIGMPESTFKLKLSQTQPAYNFTQMEYIQVQLAIIAMITDLRSTVKKMGRQLGQNIKPSK